MQHAIIVEPLTEFEEHSAEWSQRVTNLDLVELRRLKFDKGFTQKQLCMHFNLGLTTIRKALRISAHAKTMAVRR